MKLWCYRVPNPIRAHISENGTLVKFMEQQWWFTQPPSDTAPALDLRQILKQPLFQLGNNYCQFETKPAPTSTAFTCLRCHMFFYIIHVSMLAIWLNIPCDLSWDDSKPFPLFILINMYLFKCTRYFTVLALHVAFRQPFPLGLHTLNCTTPVFLHTTLCVTPQNSCLGRTFSGSLYLIQPHIQRPELSP